MPRPRKPQNITVTVVMYDGTPISVVIGMKQRIVERLWMYNELQDAAFLYEGGEVGHKDTPLRLKMTPNTAVLYAVRHVTGRQAMIGHLRGDGLDVSKFQWASTDGRREPLVPQ